MFVIKLQMDANGDFVLPIPDEIIKQLNLKAGDYVYWENTADGIALRKKENTKNQKEFQCVYLDPQYSLWHDENIPPIFETDDLALACSFVFELFKREKKDVAVWQPSAKQYREHYVNT